MEDKVFIAKFVDNIPRPIKPGIIYVSEKYGVAIHLCACGCGKETVTPLGDGEWTLTKSGDKVSLTPSIGNFIWERPNYHAHYVITDNVAKFC